jgi:hypothetical protein
MLHGTGASLHNQQFGQLRCPQGEIQGCISSINRIGWEEFEKNKRLCPLILKTEGRSGYLLN